VVTTMTAAAAYATPVTFKTIRELMWNVNTATSLMTIILIHLTMIMIPTAVTATHRVEMMIMETTIQVAVLMGMAVELQSHNAIFFAPISQNHVLSTKIILTGTIMPDVILFVNYSPLKIDIDHVSK
jgi:hypothetical protein